MSQNQVTVIETDSVIVSMKRASMALAEAKTIQQTKKILDVAHAAEIYAKRQHLGEEAMDIALSIKVEALRKLGEMLQVAPKNDGSRGTGKSGVPNRNPTLDELGLTKKESAVAQKLAALPERDFAQVREGHVTVAKAIAAVNQTKPANRMKPAQAVDVHGEDAGFDDGSDLEKYEAEVQENHRLQGVIESLSTTDTAAEIRKLKDIIDGLTGRLNASMAAQKAMERAQQHNSDFVHKLRKMLSVDSHQEILDAVAAMRAEA